MLVLLLEHCGVQPSHDSSVRNASTARTNLVPTAIRTGSAVPNQTLLVLVGVWHGSLVPNVVGTGPPFGTAHSSRCAYRHLARQFSAERGRHEATVWYSSQLTPCLSHLARQFSAERGRHGATVWYSSQLTLCLSTFGTLPRDECHAAQLTIRAHVCLVL